MNATTLLSAHTPLFRRQRLAKADALIRALKAPILIHPPQCHFVKSGTKEQARFLERWNATIEPRFEGDVYEVRCQDKIVGLCQVVVTLERTQDMKTQTPEKNEVSIHFGAMVFESFAPEWQVEDAIACQMALFMKNELAYLGYRNFVMKGKSALCSVRQSCPTVIGITGDDMTPFQARLIHTFKRLFSDVFSVRALKEPV
ncbi:hypothetical protein [Vibrio sp. F13]|uniref:hypothetical protein n=1 Tax=Vibrio sp. F13 TaxID=2070777 RepID=UPI0010BDB8F0|nr:hypothetical protein [Vibrio sp. F13]TKG01295.1 hypothetical protein FCV67_22620 [Vibrio sp. F13]